MKPHVKRLIEIMDTRPVEEFRDDGYTLRHIPSGLELWVANGVSFIESYEQTKLGLNLLDKWRIRKAYNRLRGRVWLERFK